MSPHESIVDFDNSFATFIVKGSSSYGRFRLESVTTVRRGNLSEEYLLLAPVMACDVYGNGRLFREPPYMYQALFSGENFKIFRTYLPGMRQDNSNGRVEELFEGLKKSLRTKDAHRLSDKNEVISAAMAHKPLSARIMFKGVSDSTVSVEFPIKHLNVHPDQEAFQVETGTVAIPDVDECAMHRTDGYNVAYVAFNSFDAADILVFPQGITFRKECIVSIFAHLMEENINVH